jgi:glutamine synthetase
MSNRRLLALQEVMKRKPMEFNNTGKQVSSYYGSNVFGYDAMKEYLSEEAFKMVQDAMDKGSSLDRKIADQVAAVNEIVG